MKLHQYQHVAYVWSYISKKNVAYIWSYINVKNCIFIVSGMLPIRVTGNNTKNVAYIWSYSSKHVPYVWSYSGIENVEYMGLHQWQNCQRFCRWLTVGQGYSFHVFTILLLLQPLLSFSLFTFQIFGHNCQKCTFGSIYCCFYWNYFSHSCDENST